MDVTTGMGGSVANEGAGKKPPPYGSQEYWEQRYRKADEQIGSATGEVNASSDNEPAAFHSWYFSYEDLKPIILPLILGGRGKMQQTLGVDANRESQSPDCVANTGDANGTSHSLDERSDQSKPARASERDPSHDSPTHSEEPSKGENCQQDVTEDGEDGEEDDWVEVEAEEDAEGEDEEESQLETRGMEVEGPIAVLELGCGDVPLGTGLAEDLQRMEATSGAESELICNRIVCTDYSPTVIDMMKRGHKNKRKDPPGETREDAKEEKSSNKEGKQFSVEFQVADAREMPFQDGSFHLIFEKGTMDAMISDAEVGVSNCQKIVSEIARVLAPGGCLFLVSHVNAHTAKGEEWLEEVVLTGLRRGAKNVGWTIEVHGSEPSCDDTGEEEGPPEATGPAVYLIFKREHEESEEQSDKPTIPLRFFIY